MVHKAFKNGNSGPEPSRGPSARRPSRGATQTATIRPRHASSTPIAANKTDSNASGPARHQQGAHRGLLEPDAVKVARPVLRGPGPSNGLRLPDQPTTSRTVPVITCDGRGVVSHAGTVLLAELADRIGLTAALREASDSLRERRAGHHPGRVLVDVAVAIADGAVTISDVQTLADQQGLHGPAGSVASTSTIWRALDAVANTPGLLAKIRLARAEARDRAWLARGELTGSELPGSRAAGKTIAQVVIDLDATLVTAHSDKQGARGNFKGGFGYHPLGARLDNTGEALAALLRPGNAGSNTAADHLSVVGAALTQTLVGREQHEEAHA